MGSVGWPFPGRNNYLDAEPDSPPSQVELSASINKAPSLRTSAHPNLDQTADTPRAEQKTSTEKVINVAFYMQSPFLPEHTHTHSHSRARTLLRMTATTAEIVNSLSLQWRGGGPEEMSWGFGAPATLGQRFLPTVPHPHQAMVRHPASARGLPVPTGETRGGGEEMPGRDAYFPSSSKS